MQHESESGSSFESDSKSDRTELMACIAGMVWYLLYSVMYPDRIRICQARMGEYKKVNCKLAVSTMQHYFVQIAFQW